MRPRIGYLLPTREQVMEGRPAARPLLDLAARAERLGFDPIWIGDSVTARPRHDPLTLLAAVAARVPRVQLGTAVLLPALRRRPRSAPECRGAGTHGVELAIAAGGRCRGHETRAEDRRASRHA